MKKYQCLKCKKEFYSKKGCKSRTPKFCSRKCAAIYNVARIDVKKKMSDVKKGKTPWNKRVTEEINCPICDKIIKIKIGAFHNNKFCSRECYSESLKGIENINIQGEKHWNWKGGKSGTKERSTKEYKQWQLAVFRRDHYLCQKCRVKKDMIHAHHIKKWSESKELRYNLNNGITLCSDCHGEIHGLIFTRVALNNCPDCGIKIKVGAKRCINCKKKYTQKRKNDLFKCKICNKKVNGLNRMCKSCSAKKRENNFGRDGK